ncbi:MAG: translation elongation factor Ts [Actinobacteria bacterium]|nr:translation elongation factor Ts [Actinomycetota bacterium]
MAEIKAADVAALRKATGAGMMDCKKALEESGGDLEAAKDWLRSKGLAGASKRAGRAAEQGAVDVKVEGGVGALVELTAETDFVAKSTDFKSVVADLAALAVAEGKDELAELAYEGATVGEHVTQLAAKLGENVAVGRVVLYETTDGLLDGYVHQQNERGIMGVLVELGGVDPSDATAREVAHDIALHIASAAPSYVTRDDVPGEVVEREKAVFEELTRNEGKPEQAIPKIVEGRLNGFYKDNVLVEQGFVKEPKQTIAQLLETLGANAAVRRFVRVKIGE